MSPRVRSLLGCVVVCVVGWAALAGCGGPPALEARPLAPTPVKTDGEVRHETRVFAGAGGTKIFAQSWRPAAEPRGALVIHHGLKSHGTHYTELATRLAQQGFAVHALDMRGHGRSAGARATLDSFDDLMDDLDTVVRGAIAESRGRPVFVAGHSVGGAVVTLYALERKPRIAGIVLLAPALRVDRLPIEAAATPIAAALSPNAGVVDVPNEFFCRDPAMLAAMYADPLIYQEPGPARTAATLLEAWGRIWAAADSLDIPVLGLHGTADRATDPRGTAELVRRARVKDRELLLYRGLFHDLVREPEREQVMGDVEMWLVERAPVAAGSAASP
jgi:acylglycerol lipase